MKVEPNKPIERGGDGLNYRLELRIARSIEEIQDTGEALPLVTHPRGHEAPPGRCKHLGGLCRLAENRWIESELSKPTDICSNVSGQSTELYTTIKICF